MFPAESLQTPFTWGNPNLFLICKNPKTLRKMFIRQRSDQVMGAGHVCSTCWLDPTTSAPCRQGVNQPNNSEWRSWCDNKNNNNSPTGSSADSRPQSPRVSSYKCKINKQYIHIKQSHHQHRRVCLQQQLLRLVWPRPSLGPAPCLHRHQSHFHWRHTVNSKARRG